MSPDSRILWMKFLETRESVPSLDSRSWIPDSISPRKGLLVSLDHRLQDIRLLGVLDSRIPYSLLRGFSESRFSDSWILGFQFLGFQILEFQILEFQILGFHILRFMDSQIPDSRFHDSWILTSQIHGSQIILFLGFQILGFRRWFLHSHARFLLLRCLSGFLNVAYMANCYVRRDFIDKEKAFLPRLVCFVSMAKHLTPALLKPTGLKHDQQQATPSLTLEAKADTYHTARTS